MAKTINTTEVEKFLSGVQYPCNKQDVIKQAKEKGAKGEMLRSCLGTPSFAPKVNAE